MPYIDKKRREKLDEAILDLRSALEKQANSESNKDVHGTLCGLTPEQILEISGDLNYCISRICAGLIGLPSYKKIAVVTGVLENVNQELYRRLASTLEDKKIIENGDIPEYKRLC
jgi:hypothetical protein